MGYLNNQIEHDEKLVAYFKQIGNEPKAKQVAFRIECTKNEMTGNVDPSEME